MVFMQAPVLRSKLDQFAHFPNGLNTVGLQPTHLEYLPTTASNYHPFHHQQQSANPEEYYQQVLHHQSAAKAQQQVQQPYTTELYQETVPGYAGQHSHHQQQSHWPTSSQQYIVTTALHNFTAQQQDMNERRLRPRGNHGAAASAGRRQQYQDDDDDDYELEDDEPASSDSMHESASSRRQVTSPENTAAAAALTGSQGTGGTSIKTAQRWTQEEHDLLLSVVEQFGNSRRWSEIAKHVPGRTGKQCRERWVNHMNPNSKKGSWDVAEELLLCKWHSILGSHWARITRKLEGRTENAVKNHWNAAMRAKLPMRRHTPLNMYVSHLRTGVEPSDALVKVLEALQDQHPDLVAETARAAADIVQRRLNPASAAAVAAGTAGLGGTMPQPQSLVMPAAAASGVPSAAGFSPMTAAAAAAAAAGPAAASPVMIPGAHAADLAGFYHAAGIGGTPSLTAASHLQHGGIESELQQQQMPAYGLGPHAMIAAGQVGSGVGMQQGSSPHVEGTGAAAVPFAAFPPAVHPQAKTVAPAAADQPGLVSEGDFLIKAEPAAKRMRVSNATSTLSSISPQGMSTPSAAPAGLAATSLSTPRSQVHYDRPQEGAVTGTAFHSPNVTSSNSHTSGVPQLGTMPNTSQALQPAQQQQLSQAMPTLSAAMLHQQQAGVGHRMSAAAALQAAEQARTRQAQQVVADTLRDVALRCQQIMQDLSIGEHLQALERERAVQRRQQLQQQLPAPAVVHQQQQQSAAAVGPLHQFAGDVSLATPASAVGGLGIEQQQHLHQLDELQQQTTTEELLLQQQQLWQQPHVRRAPTNLSDEAFYAILAVASDSWGEVAASADVSARVSQGGHAAPATQYLPAPPQAQLMQHQQPVRPPEANTEHPATPITEALERYESSQHDARYHREVTTSAPYRQQHHMPGLHRSQSEIVQPVATLHGMQLPDWPALTTGLGTQQNLHEPGSSEQRVQRQGHWQLDAGGSLPSLGSGAVSRPSEQGEHHPLFRTLSAPTYRMTDTLLTSSSPPEAAAIIHTIAPKAGIGRAAGDIAHGSMEPHNVLLPCSNTAAFEAAMGEVTAAVDAAPGAGGAAGTVESGLPVNGVSAGLPSQSQGTPMLVSGDFGDMHEHDYGPLEDLLNSS